MFISWLHVEDIWCILRFDIYSRLLTCWLWWSIYIDWRFWCHDFLLCFIDTFVWGIDMLDYWWLILLLCLAHWPWFCHDCSDHFTCIHSLLYITRLNMLILWLVYYFDRLWAWWLYRYPSDCRILAYLVCTLMIYLSPDCVLHGCPPFAWLRVACLCGSYIYPLTSNPLVSVTSFVLVLTFASVRPCVCLYFDRDRG